MNPSDEDYGPEIRGQAFPQTTIDMLAKRVGLYGLYPMAKTIGVSVETLARILAKLSAYPRTHAIVNRYLQRNPS